MRNILKRALAALAILSLLAGMALAEADTAANGIMNVTGDGSVYADPSAEGEALAAVKEGDTLVYLYDIRVDELGVTWYSVRCGDDASGWISADCAEYAGDDICYDTALENVGLIDATGGDSNIRVAPELDAEIVGLLKQGETAIYAGKSYVDYRGVRWDYVEFEGSDGAGREGWVSSKFTEPRELSGNS